MSGKTIEFWFEFGSTYSYLTAARIEQTTQVVGIKIEWRPFLLGPIFGAQGWNDSPFNIYPAKGRYMWRDMERLTERFGLPFKRPSSFPRQGLTAARVALRASAGGRIMSRAGFMGKVRAMLVGIVGVVADARPSRALWDSAD